MVGKVIAFDLDDVICHRKSNEGKVEKYHTCYPNEAMVKIVNQCYDAGAIIKIYTARGMTVFKGKGHVVYSNLYDMTQEQLLDWGVKFHQLVMGKLHYDLLVDDKAVNSYKIVKIKDVRGML